MKTLISSTEDSATYEFTSGDATRVVEYNKPQPQVTHDSEEPTPEQQFDHEAMSEAEYQSWLVWLGEDA
jgi:hypothetical protein